MIYGIKTESGVDSDAQTGFGCFNGIATYHVSIVGFLDARVIVEGGFKQLLFQIVGGYELEYGKFVILI